MSIRILHGDCRDVLRTLEDESVHCIVTSPPYFGLRDYGTATWDGGDPACDHVVGEIRTGLGMAALGAQYRGGGHKAAEPKQMTAKSTCPHCGARRIDSQIGLEQTPDAYVAELVGVFRECRRVLRKDGTLWLVIGDSYATQGGGGESRMIKLHGAESEKCRGVHAAAGKGQTGGTRRVPGLKPKDLIGIPWSVAFALRADGWYLRSDIIWAKPNPMPESVTDRPTKAHEYLFLLSKSERYFYDAEAIKEDGAESSQARVGIPRKIAPKDGLRAAGALNGQSQEVVGTVVGEYGGSRNKRSVWTVATQPYAESHFAVFPAALIEPAIKAGTSEKGCCAKCGAPWKRIVEKGEADITHQRACGGDAAGEYNGIATKDYASAGAQNASDVKARILAGMREKITTGWTPSCSCNATVVPCTVLDPFGGAGTTGLVADRLQRNAILIELNPDYASMAERRLSKDGGMFTKIEAA